VLQITLLMSLHQNNKLFLGYDKRCLFSHWPPASEISMLLITTFLELCVVAGKSRRRAGGLEKNGMVGARHGKCEWDTAAPHCVKQTVKTHSKPFAARHGRGTLCVIRPLNGLVHFGERRNLVSCACVITFQTRYTSIIDKHQHMHLTFNSILV